MAESWLANTRYKTKFMIEARKLHRGPLLHVDVDAVFHGDPWPYLNGLDCDAAFCVFRATERRGAARFIFRIRRARFTSWRSGNARLSKIPKFQISRH